MKFKSHFQKHLFQFRSQNHYSISFNSQQQVSKKKTQEKMDINRFNAKKIFGLIQDNKLGLKSIMTIFSYLKLLLLKLQGEEYIYWLKYLAKIISKGYGQLVLNDISLLKKMIMMINFSFQSLIVSFTNKTYGYIIFQISVLADLVKSNPNFIFPYDVKFIENTIKLSKLTGLNKQNQPKLNLIISILYLSFTQNKQLLLLPEVSQILKLNIFQHLTKISTIRNVEEIQINFNSVKNLLKINNDPQFQIQMTQIFGQLFNKLRVNQVSISQ